MADFYGLFRPLLFCLDPEVAHRLTIRAMGLGLTPRFAENSHPALKTTVAGLSFANPLGLAAGFDKHGEAIAACLALGFGHMEVGSITPRPQPGNPKPRLFRIPEAEAVINRFGFNSEGFTPALARIERYRLENPQPPHMLGINLGKNKESVDAKADYVAGVKMFVNVADYLTVNVSSPNTPGLRDLQNIAQLTDLLRAVMDARNDNAKRPPVFVKIAPDQTSDQLEDIAKVALASRVDGIIIGNTTVERPASLPEAMRKEAGGLSGAPLRDMSTRVLGTMYRLTGGKLPLIGCGGVASGRDAYVKIRAGASLVQLYTALVYEGPGLVARINSELASLLKADGFSAVHQAVGKDIL